MTIRVDSTSLIAGKTVVSLFAGHGIQAQNIPSTGGSGAGYLFNDIAAQSASPTDEMRGLLLTFPAAGALTVNEDSSFSFLDAPDGSYNFTYRGFRNGVSYGDYTVTLNIGEGATTAVGNFDLGSFGFSASASSSAPSFSAVASYDVGALGFSVIADTASTSETATITYDLGGFDFSAFATVVYPPIEALASYEIGGFSFTVFATQPTGDAPQQGSRITFAEKSRTIKLN
jgi:hypothetical protein